MILIIFVFDASEGDRHGAADIGTTMQNAMWTRENRSLNRREGLSRHGRHIFSLFVVVAVWCCCSASDGAQYDAVTGEWVYESVDEFPTYGGRAWTLGLLADFNRRGNLVGARIRGKSADQLTALERAGLEALKGCRDWTPGRHHGKAVNVLLTAPVTIEPRSSFESKRSRI